MLAEAGGSIFVQEGYGAAYNITDDDNGSLAESLVKYAERASVAEAKVSELESRMSAMEMSLTPPAAMDAGRMGSVRMEQ